ncbi:hypothetical protein ADUPG1_007961 [Aduncisulcus paluster]|uniref:Uncharacterized protein n=1 Tax=Aduncisulcus paluster TaxID=2918883 RepID=A0ABQ5KUD7_9EUKA|nr:hypothetical protein ADUPG1_007961 [Aduncisulcus paluster]|eukprot:gnl/Carplike_NY0171/12272_a17679_130.p1 GENE.gnl/Carplike_NY0171/12272_a17679_130~~gnl/Carplike_NY0171/12272_a17679_130.p1  ORF type:complete len:239 (+),score=39.94 gnl/Carplike_NY0171/12272_a17679_130:35-751(+)
MGDRRVKRQESDVLDALTEMLDTKKDTDVEPKQSILGITPPVSKKKALRRPPSVVISQGQKYSKRSEKDFSSGVSRKSRRSSQRKNIKEQAHLLRSSPAESAAFAPKVSVGRSVSFLHNIHSGDLTTPSLCSLFDVKGEYDRETPGCLLPYQHNSIHIALAYDIYFSNKGLKFREEPEDEEDEDKEAKIRDSKPFFNFTYKALYHGKAISHSEEEKSLFFVEPSPLLDQMRQRAESLK